MKKRLPQNVSCIALCYVIALLFAIDALAYTAVLKNGKRISGQIVAEDQDHIRIKDSEGVEISVRKNLLDSAATIQLNDQIAAEQRDVPTADQEAKTFEKRVAPDLPQIAGEVKAKRTGKTKVWKKEDLKDLPEITVMGSDLPPESQTPDQEELAAEEAEVERAWKEAALEIYGRLVEAQQHYLGLKKQCDDLTLAAGFAFDYLRRGGGGIGPPVISQAAEVCSEVEYAKQELSAIEHEMQSLEEDARKKGIPPGWVDPLR